MPDEFVLPGDYVGNSIEYLPGFGVYANEDDLLSSNTGNVEKDLKNHSAKLNVKTRIPKMQGIGTVTIGVVVDVSDSKALIDLIPVKSKNLELIPHGLSSILKVSDVKRGFVKSLKSEFKAGDIIKVKIINVSKHTVSLTTDSRELGVVKAVCAKCRNALKKDKYNLKCPACGFSETRKISSDYVY